MARSYRFDDEAEYDLAEALLWYETETPGVGIRFMDAVQQVARHAVEFPLSGTPVPGVDPGLGARRFIVKPFDYWLVTIPVGDDALMVIAVASQQRRPDYFHDRLAKQR